MISHSVGWLLNSVSKSPENPELRFVPGFCRDSVLYFGRQMGIGSKRVMEGVLYLEEAGEAQ
jgi:hypothetical protein